MQKDEWAPSRYKKEREASNRVFVVMAVLSLIAGVYLIATTLDARDKKERQEAEAFRATVTDIQLAGQMAAMAEMRREAKARAQMEGL